MCSYPSHERWRASYQEARNGTVDHVDPAFVRLVREYELGRTRRVATGAYLDSLMRRLGIDERLFNSSDFFRLRRCVERDYDQGNWMLDETKCSRVIRGHGNLSKRADAGRKPPSRCAQSFSQCGLAPR